MKNNINVIGNLMFIGVMVMFSIMGILVGLSMSGSPIAMYGMIIFSVITLAGSSVFAGIEIGTEMILSLRRES